MRHCSLLLVIETGLAKRGQIE